MNFTQMSKREAMNFLEKVICHAETRERTIFCTYENMEKSGYIEKSPVEEAKEKFNKWNTTKTNSNDDMELIVIQKNAIIYLEKRIDELEK